MLGLGLVGLGLGLGLGSGSHTSSSHTSSLLFLDALSKIELPAFLLRCPARKSNKKKRAVINQSVIVSYKLIGMSGYLYYHHPCG